MSLSSEASRLWSKAQGLTDDDPMLLPLVRATLALDPDHAQAWATLASFLEEQPNSDLEAAYAEMQTSLLDRSDDSGWGNAAVCFERRGDWGRVAAMWEAAACLQEITFQSDPDGYSAEGGFSPPSTYIGSLFDLAADANEKAGDHSRAKHCWRKAQEYWPSIAAELGERFKGT